MLKLFKVQNGSDITYWDNKFDAKSERDLVNESIQDSRKTVVNRGPDHWRGETG